MDLLQLFLNLIVLIAVAKSSPDTRLEALKQSYVGVLMECAKVHQVTMDDIELLRSKQMPESTSAKCLFACAYKETGMMTADGYLSVEGVNTIAANYLTNDPFKMAKASEFLDACKGVNALPVSDGSKGCDRAALIFKCSVEKGPQFGFNV